MTIQLDIPQEVEKYLGDMDNAAMNRALLEAAAVEAYRQRKIGTAGVRKMLGFEDRWDTIEFLSKFKAYPNYNEEDLEHDRATIERVEKRRAQ